MTSLDDALAALDDWPVPTASAAVIGPSGVLATRGPTEHVFRLASVTKPLAALAILVAVEEEAISLDDPADEHLVPGATVRHLLAHASGLAPERPLRSFPPATRRVYSNVGIERAADLIADATGMTFPSYLDEALEPLGLRSTSLPGSPARDGVSSVDDLARVCHELLAPTGLLAASTLADLSAVQYPELRGVLPGYGGQDPNDWGLGFEIRAAKSPHWTGRAAIPPRPTATSRAERHDVLGRSRRAAGSRRGWPDVAFGDWARKAWPALSNAVLGRLISPANG